MYKPKSSSHCCLLFARCVKIEEVQNQESESSSLPRAESVSLQVSSVSDYYDHIIRCHLSLLGIPRARFAKVAQFCCANNAPTARPFAVGNVRRVEKHVPRRGLEGRQTKGWNLCSPKSVIESQKRADARERIWRSDDGNGLSKYRRWSDWLRENTGESISRLTDTSSRTHRTSKRSSRTSSCCSVLNPDVYSKGFSVRRETWPHSNRSQQPRGTRWDSVCSVRQWPRDGESSRDRAGGSRGGMAEPIPQTAHLGIGCGSVSGDVEHSRDPPERGTSTNSGEILDANDRPCSSGGCAEHQQAGTHPLQSPPPSKGDRTGRPGTTDEQRAKGTESTRASTQEDGGQVHLKENEIDIYETDLAESMAIWGFAEDEHMFFQ